MEAFKVFGLQHILVMIFGLIGIFIALFISNINYRLIPKIMGTFILFIKLGELAYRHIINKEPIYNLLPLHLCNLALIIAILIMVFGIKSLFQVLYYWSIGAIFAILTPEVNAPLPNFVTISFFVTHLFILFAPLCCIFIFNLRPTKSGIWVSVLTLNIISLIVYFINNKLGTNYLYINRIPEFTSPLQYFGQWPYYLIVLEAIFLILAHLMYLPFRRRRSHYISKKW
ncbi:MAG: TIGR02206 family membrane protein [Fusobacteriaceae bacterium]|nr:TIGR02206 family membrane protein [Fusobacteriaceae bacterium]